MTNRKILNIEEPSTLTKVGGVVDESSVTLAVYGENLDPIIVTSLLGVEPSSAFRKGYKVKPSSREMPHGAWFLEVRGTAPASPNDQLKALFSKLPEAEHVWQELNEQYSVQLRIAVHFEGWNKGFRINKNLASRIAALGVDLEFDIYGYGEGDA